MHGCLMVSPHNGEKRLGVGGVTLECETKFLIKNRNIFRFDYIRSPYQAFGYLQYIAGI